MADIEAGTSGLDWEINDKDWAEHVEDETKPFILEDFLIAIDLCARDPEFFVANDYGIQTAVSKEARARLLDQRDEMVKRYRKEGTMLPKEEINRRVSRLLPLTPSDMGPHFMKFIEERYQVNLSRGAGN